MRDSGGIDWTFGRQRGLGLWWIADICLSQAGQTGAGRSRPRSLRGGACRASLDRPSPVRQGAAHPDTRLTDADSIRLQQQLRDSSFFYAIASQRRVDAQNHFHECATAALMAIRARICGW
jgi:hypothetical protein